jgi:hypothetical protein
MQFACGIILLVGYFGLLVLLFLGRPTIPDNMVELAKTLAIGLTGAIGLLFAFLYLRSRVDGPPDPATTTTTSTTQSTTLPTPPAQPVIIPTPTIQSPAGPATPANAVADAAHKPTAET